MKSWRYATILSLGYGLVVGTYIWVSSTLAADSATSLEQLEHLERVKGLLFVLVTTSLLFVASLSMFRRLQLASERRELDRQAILLAQRRVLAGELAAGVAHDFNNLIMIIGAALERMQAVPTDAESLDEARHALARATALAMHLAQVARGQRNTQMEIQDVVPIAKDSIKVLQRLPRLRQCQVELQGDSKVLARVDATLFEQMMANLLLNAGDAVDGHGRIHVVLMDQGENGARLEIHDNGAGIAEADREAMFSAFVTTKSAGLGLGLLSVKATVEFHGGTIKVTQSFLGGACFTVIFPRS